ncbi:hypothetical protein BCO37747_06896 [Burkholderia contaminans]|nr:hypothetical protein BCO23253_06530 [Burkholderia contaminans]VWD57774.1 hypothetical protein BCO37747_06896 [Burkholderia contaminans]
MPGLRLVHVSVVCDFGSVDGATSVPNDCTRGPCAGGTNDAIGAVEVAVTVGQLVAVCVGWTGLGVVVGLSPRPPPSWPTMTSEVGTGAGRLFVRLICSCPAGTVTTTGDQFAPAAGFAAAQVAFAAGTVATAAGVQL